LYQPQSEKLVREEPDVAEEEVHAGTDHEQENAKLKRLVADLSLDKLVLKDIASGNF
jgi:hypothetical protein